MSKCPKCNYTWINRVRNPKLCPYCKYRFKGTPITPIELPTQEQPTKDSSIVRTKPKFRIELEDNE